MAAWTVVGASVLLYYTLGGNGVKCSATHDLEDAFVGSQVVMFNQVCEQHTWLFVLMLSVSFSARWWRTILTWESGQEARVILKIPRGRQARPWSVRWSYHKTLLQSTVFLLELGLLSAKTCGSF